MKPLRPWTLIAWLAVIPAWAALPDAVTLGVAIELGDTGAARRWLDEGLDPNMEADRIGTGLMIGAWEGNLTMMELFLSRGADVHKVNRHGEQALQLAAWRGRIEAVRWLLDRGARVSRTGKAWSALHYAVFAGHGDVARLLVSRGADVDARAPNDATPLMMAAREGKEDLAKLLIDAGANPRLANDRGDTALAWAMRNGNYRIAKFVSSAEEFAKAVRVPPESFGAQKKSVPAPSEISELLRKIREAEAKGESTEALRKALMAEVDRFRVEATSLDKKKRVRTDARPTLVITASRQGKGERVEVQATPARMDWNYDENRVSDLTELMQRLAEAEKAGKPTAELRRAVQDAYRRMKGG